MHHAPHVGSQAFISDFPRVLLPSIYDQDDIGIDLPEPNTGEAIRLPCELLKLRQLGRGSVAKLIDSKFDSLNLVSYRLFRQAGSTKEDINVTFGICGRGIQRNTLPVRHPRRHSVELEEFIAPEWVGKYALYKLIFWNVSDRSMD